MSSSSPPSPSPSPLDPAGVFSLRIVSLDYYMAPPISDIDFCYSDFQGGKVEEVPVIRIYGATPAGQKACLHIHRALPYFYIPCPEDLLHEPEEVHTYLHRLSRAVEKALNYKSTASKKQHIHRCSLVRAKKLYGYHSLEDLFIKIYLYYPHEVARASSLLLGGDILDRVFQPHESHIPYLLQFLVDYNLHGMSHIHTSKFMFRPPLPDSFPSKGAYYMKHDMPTGSCRVALGGPPIWLSSTVQSASVWLDSDSGNDDVEDKNNQVIKRQSICGLELDSCVDDILNEKSKLYTSLSQTRSDVKMVQSLIPIWEEEYQRSGVQEAVMFADIRKPQPENVLRSFICGPAYENALSDICLEAHKFFPSEVLIEDKLLENCIQSCKHVKEVLTEHNRLSSPCLNGEGYKSAQLSSGLPYGGHTSSCEKKYEFHGEALDTKMPISGMNETENSKTPDNEALGLLSWLASSQAAEDLSTTEELFHEAILSPFLPTTSYKKALEIAYMDYENASQQECQDILDSVDAVKSERWNGEASVDDSDENRVSVSSDNKIPQVDGSSDDNFKTPRKEGFSERGLDNESAYPVRKCTSKRVAGKYNEKKVLWGSLPLSIKQKDHSDAEPTTLGYYDAETKNDSESGSPSSGKDRYQDASRVDAVIEMSSPNEGKISGCSVRDLMRRKRSFRVEQSESETHSPSISAEGQKNETVAFSSDVTTNPSSQIESWYNIPLGHALPSSSLIDQDYVVQTSMICTQVISKEELFVEPTDRLFNSNKFQMEHSDICCKANDVDLMCTSTGTLKAVDTCLPVVQVEPIQLPGLIANLIPTTCCYQSGKKSDTSQNYMKCTSSEIPCSKKDSSVGYQLCRLKSHSLQDHSVDDDLRMNQTFDSDYSNTVCAEHVLHEAKKCMNEQPCCINPAMLSETHFNDILEPNLVVPANTKHCLSGELDKSSSNPECRKCIYSSKGNSPPDYIEMNFCRKPPSTKEVGRIPVDPLQTSGSAKIIDEEPLDFKCSVAVSNGQGTNCFLPFFTKGSQDTELCRSSPIEESLTFHRGSALGIPSHFQNDGSVLYLLTHATSPPTLASVCQWLSEVRQQSFLNDDIGSYKERISPMPSLSYPLLVYNNSSVATGSNTAIDMKGNHSPSNNEDCRISGSENYPSQEDIVVSCESKVGSVSLKENVVVCSLQDISQISGPNEKSNLTPLSQIGFCDPASVGGGQQLTLISMEVQAESRGDLRPDPQFDAINVISLATQEDTSHSFEVYVLMRGDMNNSCGKDVDGISNCKFFIAPEEELLDEFVKIITSLDPDILMGWEIQGSSLGFIAERAGHLGIGLLKRISRTPYSEIKNPKDPANPKSYNVTSEPSTEDSVLEPIIIEDEWGRTHASGIHVGGRIVLNVWRLMRAEVKLNMYTLEAVAEEVLRRKIPLISCRVLNNWFLSGPARARYRCIEYVIERAKLNIQIMNQLDMINRTSELARVFGIDFFSVLSRGSQYRVESMLLRLAHTQNYLAISPGSQQVASQPAMECLPLVMEPESGFYVDPVVVLDFQSLYPSMVIAYNLCYSTCLGKVISSKENVLGVSSYSPDIKALRDLKEELLLTPNGVIYVPFKVRKGVLPRLLEEILSTRIMVKQSMKKLTASQQVLQRIYNARQLALKLIANVTYGYTAAGFSGRMPCAELADSIVQCGRRTLETAISFVNEHDRWKARVIYGDTDSMFVLLKGRSMEEAFKIGNEIASSITAMNPNPVTLKMEKVYHPCFLLTKKRYVGYSYESPDQDKPMFDAKGIETVRRDTCPAVAKTLEQSLRLIFEHQDIFKVRSYLQRQWTRILSGKISIQDFVFAKEVRLGTYRGSATSLPPAAIVATKAMRVDPRAEPRYGERVPYVVINGEPGARLIDMVVEPSDLMEINSPYRLNDMYYIRKQIIPALQRVFGLVGADLNQWFLEMPRPVRTTLAKRHSSVAHLGSLHEYDSRKLGFSTKMYTKRSRIDTYYVSKHCTLCGDLVQSSSYLCDKCSNKQSLVAAVVVGRTSKLEREIHHLTAICRHCGGGDWIIESGVKCTSLACSVFYERRKIQKELQSLSSFATEAGYYPSCMAEMF